jgi:hypothetical protein
MKIDTYCHVMPREYADRVAALGETPAATNIRKRISGIPALVDLDHGPVRRSARGALLARVLRRRADAVRV